MANEGDLAHPTWVKNKTPALVQSTTEQILQQARESQQEKHEIFQPPLKKQKIISEAEELAEYRFRKREEFEDLLQRMPWNNSNSVWVKYAQWEESQPDLPRARSIWERALELGYTNPTLWLMYGEMEMKNKCVDHARNVWERAVSVLPQVDQLWFEYIHMEEVLLENVDGARHIFERWMLIWEPGHHGWAAYVEFELRHNGITKARSIYNMYVKCHSGDNKAWMWYAEFKELKNTDIVKARQCYECAIMEQEHLGDNDDNHTLTEEVFVAFAQFEERCNELERARMIYQYALDHVFAEDKAKTLYQKYVQFERQYGGRSRGY